MALKWPFIQHFLWVVGPLQATGQPLPSLPSAGDPGLAIGEPRGLNTPVEGRPDAGRGRGRSAGPDRRSLPTSAGWKKPAVPAPSRGGRAGRESRGVGLPPLDTYRLVKCLLCRPARAGPACRRGLLGPPLGLPRLCPTRLLPHGGRSQRREMPGAAVRPWARSPGSVPISRPPPATSLGQGSPSVLKCGKGALGELEVLPTSRVFSLHMGGNFRAFEGPWGGVGAVRVSGGECD